MPMNGNGAQMQGNSVGACGDQQEVQQLRAEFQWQARKQEEEMANLQGHLETLERQKLDLKERWEREKKALSAEIVRYQTVLMTYAIPLEEAKLVSDGCNDMDQMDGMNQMQMQDQMDGMDQMQMQDHQPDADQAMLQQHLMQQLQIQPAWENQGFAQDMSGFGAGDIVDTESSSLNEKLRRLNGLLSEDSQGSRQQGTDGQDAEGNGNDGLGAKSIASTLQAMFPNATVRTQGHNKMNGMNGHAQEGHHKQDREENGKQSKMGLADRESGSMADPTVRKMALGLEQETGSEIDDRAMMSLRNLPVRLALEALQKVDDLVQSQGGQCRNLSSILQSVCRKLERWSSGREDAHPVVNDKRPDVRNGYGNPALENGDQKAKRVSKTVEADADPKAKTDEEELSVANGQEYWTQKRVENMADVGVELKQEGDQWRLRVVLAGLEPPLPESGMGRFCAWLRKRLASFRQEHGPKALRQCQGDIDFSNNNLSNESLWMLLESLAQFEVQAATLKLNRNRISSAGILALCEFIQNSKGAGPVHEMHLAHNEIDDDSALELLRTLKESQPRYPPRRAMDGAQGGHLVPVWIGLNQNRIADPAAVLNTLQAEGITYSQDASPVQVARKKCPLLNLYHFQDQAVASKVPALTNGSPTQEKTPSAIESASAKKRVRNKQAKEEDHES